jgi:hypothetical protein
MSNLFDFLTDLATNPKQQVAFRQTPDAVMEAAGLTETEQTVIKSGDRINVVDVYSDELDSPTFCMVDPNPDPMPDPDPPPSSQPSEED